MTYFTITTAKWYKCKKKPRTEGQAWQTVLSAALFIELFMDLFPSQRTHPQRKYSEINGDAKFQ